MIVVDTSALIAVLMKEPLGPACMDILQDAPRVLISAATVAETLIVASHRRFADKAATLIEGLGCEVVTVDAPTARRVADAHLRWGKGVHPAGLNLGDCFSYDLASSHACPLLYIGHDFARTDIRSAI